MSASRGYGAWLTEDLKARALDIVKDDPGIGVPKLSRKLDCTAYRANVLLKFARQDVEITEPQQLRARLKEVERELAAFQDSEGKVKLVADAMTAEIKNMPKIDMTTIKRSVDKKLDPEDVVIVISDVHIGAWVNPDTTGGLGKYNYSIFVARLERMAASILSILAYMPNHVDNIHVVFAGDIIDGGRVFRGHARQTDLIVAKQVIHAYERFAGFVAMLSSIQGSNVIVSFVPGNHGRIGDKGELAPHDNFDFLLGWFLQERFDLMNIKNVRFNIPETWWMLLKVRETSFHVSHGDSFKSWAGIPFYGALRYKQRLRELLMETFLPNCDGDLPMFDALITGHFHELAYFNNIYMNGTFVGGSEYSLKDLQVGGPPYQLMLGVHDTIGVSWTRKLVLADRRNKPQVPMYS